MVAVSSEAELAAQYDVYVTESETDRNTPHVFGGIIFKQGLDNLGENFHYVIRFGAGWWVSGVVLWWKSLFRHC